LNNVKERDKIDSSRAVSPLRPAKDAIIIDNTNIGIEEQFAMVISLLAVRYGNGIDVLLAD
jgi:cytidylate kinase